ncbi:MAG: hypothetical protein IJ043_04985 [Clostridia bacterium]|nr:hypothetical protein [Clostridia bacterium]
MQSLNGKWSYRIGKGTAAEIAVPFSALPVGHSECERSFDLEKTADRILLQFEGITYYARVFLNGEYIGEMLPYCRYTFDITEKAKSAGNLLRVELEDLAPSFGPSEGWENFGGIIRDVSLVYPAFCAGLARMGKELEHPFQYEGESVTAPNLCPAAGNFAALLERVNAADYPLRNGMEVTTVFTLHGSSRIVPIAENAQKIANFSYDKNFEQYILNKIQLSVDKNI